MTARPNCREVSACKAKTPGKHCAACSLSALHRDPEFRAKRAAAFRERLASDSEFRARHNIASAKRLEAWRRTVDGSAFTNANSRANIAVANTPENTAKRVAAIRRARFAGIPEAYWPAYAELPKDMPARQRKAIILDQVARDERRRLAAMSPHERAMERVRQGATVSVKVPMPSRVHDFSLTGGSL